MVTGMHSSELAAPQVVLLVQIVMNVINAVDVMMMTAHSDRVSVAKNVASIYVNVHANVPESVKIPVDAVIA